MYYRQIEKYKKDPKELPRQIFRLWIKEKRKRKIKSKLQKKDLLKSVKRKKIHKKPKKGWFLQKHRIEEPTIREYYKNHKI